MVPHPRTPYVQLRRRQHDNAARLAVVRLTVVTDKSLLQRTYTAVCYDTLESATEGINSGKVKPGDAVIVRYQGPRSAPAFAECLSVVGALKALKIPEVIVIADGRFSGFTQGYLSIGHVCPEAQVGGPIALVKDGDKIAVDIPNRKLQLEVSDEELAKRKAEWKPKEQRDVKGMLGIYAKLALQADEGAGWPARWEDFD